MLTRKIMAPTKWSESDTIKFVRLYRESELLWNSRNEYYKNREKRISALEQIQNEMNMKDLTMEIVKKKIKAIRDTYKIEKKKLNDSMRSATSSGVVYRPRLIWFEDANFLDNGMDGDSILSGADPSIKIEILEATQTIKENLIEQEKVVNKVAKRKRVDTPSQMDTFGLLKKSSVEKDEFDYFAINISHQLRSLSLERALNCQTKIQKLLAKERIEQEKDQQFSCSCSNNTGLSPISHDQYFQSQENTGSMSAIDESNST